MSSEKKSSEKKLAQERERQRLEALQNTEKKFLKGMYGDFFGESGSSQSAGSRIDALAEKGKDSGAGGNGGIISKLTSIAAKLLSSDNQVEGRVWSMKEYINTVSDKEFPGPVEEREKALQEIETSIIANLADEITVKINPDEVIIEAEKRL